MAKKESLDDMRDEAYRRQDNLAADIDELLDRVNPKNAVLRWKNELVESVKGFTDAADEKSPVSLPVAIAGGVIGLAVISGGIAGVVALSRHRAAQRTPSARLERAIKEAGKNTDKAIADVRKSVEQNRKQAGKKAAKTRKQAGKKVDNARDEAGKSLQEARKQGNKKVAETIEAVRG